MPGGQSLSCRMLATTHPGQNRVTSQGGNYCQGGKRNPNPNFLVRISSCGVGVFHVNGVGAKKFDTSLETREIKLFGRDIPGFRRDIPGAPEEFDKKRFVFNSCPLYCVAFCEPLRLFPRPPFYSDPNTPPIRNFYMNNAGP